MKIPTLGKRIFLFLLLAFAVYILSYLFIRFTSVQTWEKNGRDYVIFPKNPIFLYYLFRPASLIDGRLTGIGIHIGPHED